MCCIRTWIAIGCAVLSFAGLCNVADTLKVCGKGTGIDKAEALKDAYRDAVERAVGLYVDAEQTVENDELVKDKILTQSNAYIEKYELVRESSSANGLVTIDILADVRKRELTRKIRDVIPSHDITLSENSKNLHAKIITDFKSNDDALAIVRNELEGLQPLKQLMNVTLATTQPVVESVKEDDSLARLWYPVKIEVDAAKYYKEFAPRWSRILDQIKVAPSKRLDLKNNSQYASNDELSSARALSVFEFFQNNTSLDPALMKHSGRGEYVPIADNSTSEGRDRNRRVEIKIYHALSNY